MTLSWEDRRFYRRLFLLFVPVPLLIATIVGLTLWSIGMAIVAFFMGVVGMFLAAVVFFALFHPSSWK
jgi:hypothetical protein